jgi:hypothetical protein
MLLKYMQVQTPGKVACKDCLMVGHSAVNKTIYAGGASELPQYHPLREVYSKKMAKPFKHHAFKPPRTRRTHESIMAAGRESEEFKGGHDHDDHPRKKNGFHKEPYFSKVTYMLVV